MAYEIIIKKRFYNKVVKLLDYLENEWGSQVAESFLNKLDKRIESLSDQPFTGLPIKNYANVRSVLIAKHNRIYYRIEGNRIEVLNMFDTRINPDRNPYKRS